MKQLLLSFAVLLTLTQLQGQSTTNLKLFCDKTKSSITYGMHHPLHAWTGTNNDVTSVILTDETKTIISQVAVTVKLAGFDSKNANRDSHVLEVTEGLKFPIVKFSSSSIETKGDKLMVKGTMTFHGVSQPVSFEANYKKVNDKLEISGNFSVTMTQFGIEPPSLLAIPTDDEIKMSFSVVY
jgi:polyisoprenoid-binding protein YceI